MNISNLMPFKLKTQTCTIEGVNEETLIAALERKPAVAVPQDFAARVIAALPAQRPRERVRWGRRVAVGAGVTLTVALFGMAPHTAASFASLAFDLELLMLAQLAGLGWWVASRRDIWQ